MTDSRSLDLLLEDWAREVGIRPDDVERIRVSIVMQPEPPPRPPSGLQPQWWRTLAFQVSDIVVQASRQPALAR
jgi:hypothetical protein